MDIYVISLSLIKLHALSLLWKFRFMTETNQEINFRSNFAASATPFVRYLSLIICVNVPTALMRRRSGHYLQNCCLISALTSNIKQSCWTHLPQFLNSLNFLWSGYTHQLFSFSFKMKFPPSLLLCPEQEGNSGSPAVPLCFHNIRRHCLLFEPLWLILRADT